MRYDVIVISAYGSHGTGLRGDRHAATEGVKMAQWLSLIVLCLAFPVVLLSRSGPSACKPSGKHA